MMFSRHPQELQELLLHDQLMEKKAAQPPPRLPRHGIWRTIDITRYVDGATFHLQASLAPNHIVKTEPLTDIHVEVRRKATKVIIPEAAASPIYPVEPLHCYILPGYLVREPDPPCFTNFPLRASLLCCPSTAPADYINWIPADIRIEEGRRDDLVSSMMNFLGEVVVTRRGEGYEFLTMHLSVTIEHNVIYSCGARRASPICIMTDSIEDEIRVEKKEKEKEEEKDMPVECAVCFEEVKFLRGHDFCCSWSVPRSGVQLCCSHVFHLSCIAPWLTNHDSCPMCRRPQHHFEFVVHYNP